jgi:hypothetical protein
MRRWRYWGRAEKELAVMRERGKERECDHVIIALDLNAHVLQQTTLNSLESLQKILHGVKYVQNTCLAAFSILEVCFLLPAPENIFAVGLSSSELPVLSTECITPCSFAVDISWQPFVRLRASHPIRILKLPASFVPFEGTSLVLSPSLSISPRRTVETANV